MTTTRTSRISGAITAANTQRVSEAAPWTFQTSRISHLLLLEGDMQDSGSDVLLLEGDMQSGTDALKLEGDITAITETTTKRVAEAVT